jgi:hypothetical protein
MHEAHAPGTVYSLRASTWFQRRHEGQVSAVTARRRTPSVLTALHTALKAKPPADADLAAVALAKRYALELDDSGQISRAVAKALRKVLQSGQDELYDELLVLATRVEEAQVAALVGPKLLAALEQLQLTPKARSGVLQGGGIPDAGTGKSALDELRDRRANRAPAMDSPS